MMHLLKNLIIFHNNSFIYEHFTYKNNKQKINIKCIKHNILFEQQISGHLSGQNGCPECKRDKITLSNDEFISKAKEIHGNRYSYEYTKYISYNFDKVKITCSEHGIFEMLPNTHLNGNGCKQCNTSKGEAKIAKTLSKLGKSFTTEYQFDDCKNIKKLRFDFYLDEYNLLIEYDGLQHFQPVDFFGGIDGYEERKKCDEIKNNFCKNNNINLLRISYCEDVEQKIKQYFNSLDKNKS